MVSTLNSTLDADLFIEGGLSNYEMGMFLISVSEFLFPHQLKAL